MSILEKIVDFIKDNQEDIILIVGVILISLLCFAAGYLTAIHNQKEEIKVKHNHKQQGAASIPSLTLKLNYTSTINFSLVRKYEKSSYHRSRRNGTLSGLEII